MKVNILAIIQARMGSVRFPGKVLKKVNEKTIIEILFHRVSLAKSIDKIILATSVDKNNDILVKHVKNLGFEVYRGSENNILSRYFEAARIYKPKTIIRITGDCPLIDPKIIDKVVKEYKTNKFDYVSNTNPPTFPDGLDVEVFSFDTLKLVNEKAKKAYDKEHVTPFIKSSNQFEIKNIENYQDLSNERWTLDVPKDLQVIQKIIKYFSPNLNFSFEDILQLKKKTPRFFIANKNITRNIGSIMGGGQKLYLRAKNVIPGGTMLLSKKPEIFLPEHWPAYFSKSKGCEVWDLDDKKYIDMSIMGIGTNTLGYGNEEVDDAVKKVINKGNMSTLNCPEEVYLAERLIDLHPWADMARFARSGGEANSIAIRIARAAIGKEKIAICGYHGWHDWYLSANIGNSQNLDDHLLPGLNSKGVPRGLKGTVIPFKYNDIESLKNVLKNNDIGIIKMEVSRSFGPKKGFLESVRKLASKENIILIFDECTSGFRETFGGLHKKYSIEPDMIMLGKTLGNGYAITAVLGKRRIMKFAESSFISSTFWTERIGPTAALKTLEVMEKKRSWKIITKQGKKLQKLLLSIAKKYKIPLEISGIPALINFKILSKNWLKYKTYISQEMLKKGYLASNAIYVCTEHTDVIIEDYIKAIEPIFKTIQQCENDRDINKLLKSEVCHSGFKRIN